MVTYLGCSLNLHIMSSLENFFYLSELLKDVPFFIPSQGILVSARTYARMFVHTCPDGVIALQTSFLNRLSRNFTHMFTNVISCTSSNWAAQVTCTPPPPLIGGWPLNRRHRSTGFISLPIVMKFHTHVHKHHLLYEFENGHHRSHVSPPNRGLLPPLKIQIPQILMKFKPYVLATK